MKFTYTHITKDYTEIAEYKSYTNTNCVPKFCRELQTITEQ